MHKKSRRIKNKEITTIKNNYRVRIGNFIVKILLYHKNRSIDENQYSPKIDYKIFYLTY